MIGGRRLSIAAGTLRGATPPEAVEAAAGAGFDALGLRFDIEPPTAQGLRHARHTLDGSGLSVLDVEVVRIRPGDDDETTRQLSAWGEAVGAAFLLVVSDDPDRGRTVARFAETCATAADHGMRAVLEFMRFTAVPTLTEAVEVVTAAGMPGAGVLVDALHLARSGDEPDVLASVAADLLPYAQLCDATATPPAGGVAALADEARHARSMPGTGALPLAALLHELPPQAPLSLEILSDAWDGRPRAEVALVAMAAARRVLQPLEGHGAGRGGVATAPGRSAAVAVAREGK